MTVKLPFNTDSDFKYHQNILIPVFIMLMAAIFVPSKSYAVASFARQTGMTCNQCHTSHGGATPNFTFSGKKFNAMGYRLSNQPDAIKKGKSSDQGEYLSLKPTEFSGRFQWTLFSNVKPPAGPNAGEWGETQTTPTARFALFPFTGPIGDHFGVWTETYIIPSSSANGEWTIANASWEEHDFRYIINPNSQKYIFGVALNNQGIGDIFGFGPWPAVGLDSYLNRGGIGGYQHPNKGTLAVYGWMNDRWVWALGGETGDTNTGWDDSNLKGILGYAWLNSNANELWTNVYFRTGDDALPLVTDTTVPKDKHDFYFEPAISGISDTRPATCPSNPAFIAGGCPYLAEDLSDHYSIDAEVRWSQNNFAKPLSFEIVGRLGFNKDEYTDNAQTKLNTWGIAAQFAWEHTYYVKPYIKDSFKYDFTDRLGVVHDVDTSPIWGVYLGYKPVENFMLNFGYHKLHSYGLNRDAMTHGARWDITADISF